MERKKKILLSSFLKAYVHDQKTASFALTLIFAEVKRCFPVITQITWSSYRADNEIHELVIDHQQGQFVLTMVCGLGPTVFISIMPEDLTLNQKRVEFMDSVDIFHFVQMAIDNYGLGIFHIHDNQMIFKTHDRSLSEW